MRLHRAGREYVKIPLEGLPDPAPAAVQVQFDDGGTWYNATIDGTDAVLLIAGPDATDNPAGTVVLSSGRHLPLMRTVDNPEVVIRVTGPIDVYPVLDPPPAPVDQWASAAQGTLATTAVQPEDLATVATTGAYADLTGRPALGTASAQNVGAFAPATSSRPGGGTVYLGDSITLGSDQFSTRTIGQSWPTFASLLTGQKLLRVHNAGVGGETAAQMLARFDAEATPHAPRTVILLAGTNDAPTVQGFDAWKTTMLALVDKVRTIGATVVLATIPPKNVAADKPQIARMNAWLKAYTAAAGVPLLDFYTVLADPATSDYKAAYLNDGVHPNGAGMVAMGSHAAAVLTSLPPTSAPLVADDVDKANLLYKGTFGGYTGSTVPTGWINGLGTPTGSTLSYVTDAAVPGQMVQIANVATTGARNIQFDQYIGVTTLSSSVSAGATSLTIPIRADYAGTLFIGTGSTFEIAKIASSSGAGPQTETLTAGLLYAHTAGEQVIANAAVGDELIFTGVVTSDGGTSVNVDAVCVGGAYSPSALRLITASITRGVWYQRFTVPTGTTRINYRLQVSSGTGTASFGRVGVYNATRLGL